MYKLFEKSCEHCGDKYLGTIKSKYCSYNCSHSSRRKRVILTCQECGKQFERQQWNSNAKYCSYNCKSKSQASDIISVICSYCSKPFLRKSHKLKDNNFCSCTCASLFNKGSNHYEWKENLHDKNEKSTLKQWSVIIKQRDSYTCQKCGNQEKEFLQSHHIKSRSKFPELRFEISNGITLCSNCHAIEHKDDHRAVRLITFKKCLKTDNAKVRTKNEIRETKTST